jgi:hypothetical protein
LVFQKRRSRRFPVGLLDQPFYGWAATQRIIEVVGLANWVWRGEFRHEGSEVGGKLHSQSERTSYEGHDSREAPENYT